MARRPTIAYVIDPRFPGGTSAAVAAELRLAVTLGDVTVHALETRMFRGRTVAPPLADALTALGLDPKWDTPVIAADLVIFHNPVCLKFESDLGRRIVARDLAVVTHANPVRPDGQESFAVAACLGQVARASLAVRRWVAPISAVNRAALQGWLAQRGGLPGWQVLPWDWHNICEAGRAAPAAQPEDRRGRHSRPGLEKFPPLQVLDLCFPRHARANVILGADLLADAGRSRPHWELHGFGALAVDALLDRIDFMVYYTSPFFAESFGRVLAESIAAGKVVLSDPGTAATFGGGVLPVQPGDVDAAVAALVADPARYARQVRMAQDLLAGFSAAALGGRIAGLADGAQQGQAA